MGRVEAELAGVLLVGRNFAADVLADGGEDVGGDDEFGGRVVCGQVGIPHGAPNIADIQLDGGVVDREKYLSEHTFGPGGE